VRVAFTLVLLCCASAAAAGKRAPASWDDARNVLQARGCGSCHDTAVSTEHPAALAVYDLHEPDWPARMSDERLPKLMSRLKSAPASDREVVKRFIAAELAARADRAR